MSVGRPALVIGTHGKISYETVTPALVRARTRFRDIDGRTRFIRGQGKSRSAAERNLEWRLAERMKAVTTLTGAARLGAVMDEWITQIEENTDLAAGTKRLYRLNVEKHLRPLLGGLLAGELSIQLVNNALRKVRDQSGPSAGRTARSVLSGVLAVAVKNGALAANPVREAISFKSARKSATRALSPDETAQLVDALRASELALRLDLPDLVEWMLYTGCRIGEALAVRDGTSTTNDGRPLLDREHGTWEVNATIVRVTGQGLVIQLRTKSDAGWRVLALPPGAVAMLQRRAAESRLSAPHGIVFGSPLARELRDPSNTDADLREFLDGLDCDQCARTGYQIDTAGDYILNGNGRKIRCRQGPWSWVTSHTFRKTVITRLDEAGQTPRLIADQAGHSKPSMTMDVYMGRNVVNAAAAGLLDR